MASSERIIPLPPETLPADFNDWDCENSCAPGEQAKNVDAILAAYEKMSRVRPSASRSPILAVQPNRFGGWQRGSASAPLLSDPGQWGTVETLSKPEQAIGESVERKAAEFPLADWRPDPWPPISEPVFAKPHKATGELANERTAHDSRVPGPSSQTDDQPGAEALPGTTKDDGAWKPADFSSVFARKAGDTLGIFAARNLQDEDGPKLPWNRRAGLVMAGTGSILLSLTIFIAFGHRGTAAAARPSARAVQRATDAQPIPVEAKPAVSETPARSRTAAASKRQQTTDKQPAGKDRGEGSKQQPSEMQTEIMSDQLTAPRMISPEMKKQMAENTLPPANPGAGADGLRGNATIGSLFSGSSRPIVKSAKPITISSGVAAGMLIEKTAPVYPPIAKSARVSGTVELNATISKSGTIQDAHVVSGPVMLQQAAIDAVRRWRYKPYRLNDVPVDVDAIVSVVFALNK